MIAWGELVMPSLEDVASIVMDEFPRWERARTGDRDYIPALKRRLVYERDGFMCLWCGAPDTFDYLQLDHIVPWSAFDEGTPAWFADRSDNLRTLCAPCNNKRSNRDWPEWRRVVGVTECCWDCMFDVDHPDAEAIGDDPIKAYCGCCGTTSLIPNDWWLL